ncbi:MAG: type II toxin-antitoxin system HicA family toxin [Thaumarchaeota archaeon]|nr:type II toxin-antitoxin system HicA family toxin [Nitrososphaerota archaeon]
MSLPIIGWKEVLKALKKQGFYATRQSGSHIIVENGQGLWTSIPRKNEFGKGLLLQIISDCGLTKKEFLELL